MADICEISRLRECMEAGSHEPLELPGDDPSAAQMERMGVTFGLMHACRRCGILYWEPAPPPVRLEPTEE